MGYYNIVEVSYQVEKGKVDELIKELKKQRENPFVDNMSINDSFAETGYTYFSLDDCYVKLLEYHEWIPLLAKYGKGTITFYGDEKDDIWKVELKDGEVEAFTTKIEFIKIPFEYL